MIRYAKDRATNPRLYLTPADQGRRLSLEEFESADAQEGYRYELIRGKLEVFPFPELPHEWLRHDLRDVLDEYTRQHPETINELFGPAQVIVPDQQEGVTALETDLACYRDFPLDLSYDEVHWRDVSPMVVVEVISAECADKDLTRNVPLYLQVPTVCEYWIVDPRKSHDRPSMLVYRRRGQRWQNPIRVKAGGTYTTRLLPDFTLLLDRFA
jgi:Uma2 family endonuclease